MTDGKLTKSCQVAVKIFGTEFVTVGRQDHHSCLCHDGKVNQKLDLYSMLWWSA